MVKVLKITEYTIFVKKKIWQSICRLITKYFFEIFFLCYKLQLTLIKDKLNA